MHLLLSLWFFQASIVCLSSCLPFSHLFCWQPPVKKNVVKWMLSLKMHAHLYSKWKTTMLSNYTFSLPLLMHLITLTKILIVHIHSISLQSLLQLSGIWRVSFDISLALTIDFYFTYLIRIIDGSERVNKKICFSHTLDYFFFFHFSYSIRII